MARWSALAALAAVLLLYLGVGLFDHDVWSPTEPATTGVVWEMSAHGRLAVPRINDFLFLEKPPLYYWLALAASGLGGELTIGWIRLPAALAGLGCLALVFATLRPRNGSAVAIVTTLFGASCLQLFLIAHRASTDILAILFVFAAWAAYVRGQGRASRAVLWDVALAAVLAGSFYAKNLYPALVAVPPVVICLAWERRFGRLARLAGLGALLLAVATLPWALSLYREGGGEYLRIVFVDNTLGRFFDLDATNLALRPLNDAYVTERDGSVLYYVPVLLLLGAPWLGFVWAAAHRLFRGGVADDPEREVLRRFLRVALVTVPLVLTASSSRVSNYLDPLLFVLLLAIGDWLHTLFTAPEEVAGVERWLVRANLLVLAALAVAAPIAIAVVAGMGPALGVALAVVLAGGVLWRATGPALLSPRFFVSAGIAVCVLYAVVLRAVIPIVDDRKSSTAFFAAIADDVGGRRILTDFLDVTKLPLLNFYLDRRVEVERDPAVLAEALASHEPVALIVRPSLIEREQARFASIPHETRRAESGKGRRSFVYLANRPSGRLQGSNAGRLEESHAVP